MKQFLVLLLVSLSVVGCGKKGAPEAPELSAPSPVRTFTAAGDTRGILLRWTAPATTASDDELTNLAGFYVERNFVIPGERAHYDRIADLSVPEPGQGDPVNFQYQDAEVQPGRAYEYRIVPYNREGVLGKQARVLRVVFLGESSTVEVY